MFTLVLGILSPETIFLCLGTFATPDEVWRAQRERRVTGFRPLWDSNQSPTITVNMMVEMAGRCSYAWKEEEDRPHTFHQGDISRMYLGLNALAGSCINSSAVEAMKIRSTKRRV